jgi:hypothetical protein
MAVTVGGWFWLAGCGLQCTPRDHWAREYLDRWYAERSVVLKQTAQRAERDPPTSATAAEEEADGDEVVVKEGKVEERRVDEELERSEDGRTGGTGRGC